MRANYNLIDEIYNIRNTIIDSALEADVMDISKEVNKTNKPMSTKGLYNISNTDEETQVEKMDKKSEAIKYTKEVITKAEKMYTTVRDLIQNREDTIVKASKEFDELIYDAKRNKKPKELIEVTMYNYRNNSMSIVMANITKDVDKLFMAFLGGMTNEGDSERINELVSSTKTDFEKTFYAPYVKTSIGSNESIDTFPKFNKNLLEYLRNGKVTKKINMGDIEKLNKVSSDTSSLLDSANQYLRNLNRYLDKIKSILVLINRTNDNTQLAMMIRYTSKILILYNIYMSMIQFTMEYRLEKILSARAILKRFYEIN